MFAASSSARRGHYVREDRLDELTTFTWWVGEVGGHGVESLDVVVDDDHGLVQERWVAFRPFPAALFRAAVYPALRDLLGGGRSCGTAQRTPPPHRRFWQ